MGKWKAIIPIAMAVVIALSGSVFLYKWMKIHTAPKETVKVKSEAVPVCVAAVDLQGGTKLNKEMIKTVPFLKESLPAGYFTDVVSLKDRVVISPMKMNEPIIEHRLAPESVTVGGVSAVVKPGKRAIAVKGDKVLGISGFIKPGNRVDVLVTTDETQSNKEITKIVLENMLVLATGAQMQEGANGEPSPVDVYTLEVTPEEGEKLTLAASKGRLQFALRNAADSETVLTQGATMPQTLASFRWPESEKPAKGITRRARSSAFTVEVIKGSDVSKKRL